MALKIVQMLLIIVFRPILNWGLNYTRVAVACFDDLFKLASNTFRINRRCPFALIGNLLIRRIELEPLALLQAFINNLGYFRAQGWFRFHK